MLAEQFCDEDMKHLSHLHTLDLLGTRGIGDRGMSFLNNLNINTLCLATVNITDDGLTHLGNIHTLDLRNCNHITDKGLIHLINTHTLDLAGCEQITNHGVSNLSPSVKMLSLDSKGINYACLQHLVHLEVLQINNIESYDDCLQSLAHLKVLALRGCIISDYGMKFLTSLNVKLIRSREYMEFTGIHVIHAWCVSLTEDRTKTIHWPIPTNHDHVKAKKRG